MKILKSVSPTRGKQTSVYGNDSPHFDDNPNNI